MELHDKKTHHVHLSLVDKFVPERYMFSSVYNSFVSNSKNMEKYLSLSNDEQDQFLIDYICMHDGVIANRYDLILGDKFPELSNIDKLKRRSYMITHNIFDENSYDDSNTRKLEKRVVELDSKF